MVSGSNRNKSAVYKQIRNRKSKTPEYDYSEGVSETTESNDRGNIEVMTAKSVAELLQVSTWLVYELVKQNEIPHFKVGRSVRFIKSEVVGWML